jgi:CspA family cold shock protein
MAGETQRGVVKWFNDAKGFGFIEHTSGKDVFVHYSVIQSDGFKTLKDGEQVEYEIKEGPKGLHAMRVQRLISEQAAAAGAVPAEASAASMETVSETESH